MHVAHILHHIKWRFASLTPLQRVCVVLIVATQVLVFAMVTYYGGDQILHSLARLAAWISHSKLGILILYISMTVCALPPQRRPPIPSPATCYNRAWPCHGDFGAFLPVAILLHKLTPRFAGFIILWYVCLEHLYHCATAYIPFIHGRQNIRVE